MLCPTSLPHHSNYGSDLHLTSFPVPLTSHIARMVVHQVLTRPHIKELLKIFKKRAPLNGYLVLELAYEVSPQYLVYSSRNCTQNMLSALGSLQQHLPMVHSSICLCFCVHPQDTPATLYFVAWDYCKSQITLESVRSKSYKYGDICTYYYCWHILWYS